MNKIVLANTTSAIFLAIVLVTGTIAAISPSSFIIKGVNAQGDPYYEMDNNDYDDSYGYSDYRDDRDKKKDDSYGYSDYGMDKDKKPYGSDSYKSQYSSYEPDYKPKYSSYDKDDKRDKSKKDSSKSVLINKINCINNNLNINGNNTGDINVGNKGTAGGYLDAYSSDGSGSGYGGGEGYDGFKKDKDFTCIINNNNTNTNIVTVGGGNVTDGNETDQCAEDIEACFERFLTEEQFEMLSDALGSPTGITIEIAFDENEEVTLRSFTDFCLELEDLSFGQLEQAIGDILEEAGIDEIPVDIIACIAEVLNIPPPG